MKDKILLTYKETESIKETARKCGCSWQRVIKILSSEGVVVSETHCKILQMHEEGYSVEQIAETLRMNVKVVKAYLPSVRPYYNINRSENAIRISKWRSKNNGH